jgi:hypothetical protein
MIIEVRIPSHQLVRLQHDIHIGWHVMKELHAAGIPVDGTLVFRGVRNGTLTMCTDLDDSLVYVWEGDTPLAKVVEETEAEIW